MDKKSRNIIIAAAVILLLVLIWAWDKCYLGAYSKKGCPNASKGNFCGSSPCGADPDPAAMSEAAGLHELGTRMEGFCCSRAPAPSALAEAQGLMQMGWRPEHLKTRPTCASAHPAAVAEAQALQHAHALSTGAPYYTERFAGGLDEADFYGVSAPEAEGEAHLLAALQVDVDSFAAHKLTRDNAARSSTTDRSEQLRSNPAQIDARQARFNSMRENFGGPPGYGWTPSVASSPATCFNACMDGCSGTSCGEHCEDTCHAV